MLRKYFNIISTLFFSLICIYITVGLALIGTCFLNVQKYFCFLLVSLGSMGIGFLVIPWLIQKNWIRYSSWKRSKGKKIDYVIFELFCSIGIFVIPIIKGSGVSTAIMVSVQNFGVAFCEEYFTKEIIFTKIGVHWGHWVVPSLVSAIVFAFLIHSSDPFMTNLAYRFPMGFCLALIYYKRKNIMIPVSIHFLNNMFATAML